MSRPLVRFLVISIALVLALWMAPISTHAQPGPPPDPDVPISGIEFLLGGGALLGIRQLWVKAKSSLKK